MFSRYDVQETEFIFKCIRAHKVGRFLHYSKVLLTQGAISI